jgi:hypothetical protein
MEEAPEAEIPDKAKEILDKSITLDVVDKDKHEDGEDKD